MYPKSVNMEFYLQVTIHADDMDLTGDLVQVLAQFLNLDDLHTTIDFPIEMEKLREVLVKVGNLFTHDCTRIFNGLKLYVKLVNNNCYKLLDCS